MSGVVPIILTVSAIAVLMATSVLRSVVHRHRERVQGIGGTQDIAMWGLVVAWALLIAAMVTGVIWLAHRSRPNQRSAVGGGLALCLHIGPDRYGATDSGCSAISRSLSSIKQKMTL
jgi:hypothetical protein